MPYQDLQSAAKPGPLPNPQGTPTLLSPCTLNSCPVLLLSKLMCPALSQMSFLPIRTLYSSQQAPSSRYTPAYMLPLNRSYLQLSSPKEHPSSLPKIIPHYLFYFTHRVYRYLLFFLYLLTSTISPTSDCSVNSLRSRVSSFLFSIIVQNRAYPQ